MTAALLQMDIEWGNPLKNIQHAEALMNRQAGCDLYVLPEMWTTGFTCQPSLMADSERSSSALQWMRQQATMRQCALCGSMAVLTDNGIYRNRMYFVTPERVFHYDKHHLFSPGHEHEQYVAGAEHTIVSWKGMRFQLLVCYDLRFPVWSRYGVAGEYDAIICVANWPSTRQHAWQTLLQARAIENQCYVIAVNRVGADPKISYSGGSMVVSPSGEPVIACNDNTEQLLSATLSIDELSEFRMRFNTLADRDALNSINI